MWGSTLRFCGAANVVPPLPPTSPDPLFLGKPNLGLLLQDQGVVGLGIGLPAQLCR